MSERLAIVPHKPKACHCAARWRVFGCEHAFELVRSDDGRNDRGESVEKGQEKRAN